jgi:predicted RND superfamily exporter protein
VTFSDFLPEDQDEKLEIIADLAMLLDLRRVEPLRVSNSAEAVEALEGLRAELLAFGERQPAGSKLGTSSARLAESLATRIEAAEEDPESLARLETVLLENLPGQLRQLDANLNVETITRASLPKGLTERMLAKDGHARVQVYPSEDLWDDAAMVAFVESVRLHWSDITGLPVNLVESADATWSSLREAMLWATVAIVFLLLALWRRIGDTLIALGPLLLAVLLTQVSTLVLPVDFTFANVMVLPLLLGIGIDGGVHIVYRAHRHGESDLHSGATTQAVWYSALTTIASFGMLVISAHRGVASLGFLLVVGMIWVLAANLVLLPALLRLRAGRASS